MGDNKLSLTATPVRPRPAGAEAAVAWSAVGGAPSRHGAIARQVSTYTHYKNWAEKMRNTWQKEEPEPAAVEPSRPR
jgi:hypothetical protein